VNKRIIITLLIAGCFCVNAAEPVVRAANTVITAEQLQRIHETQEKGRQNAEKQQVAWKQWFENLKPINVYGKVLDNAGKSVEGAKIKVQWEHTGYKILGQIETRWVETDKEGRFIIELGKADIEPHIYEVACAGYEFTREYSSYFANDQTGENNPLLSTLEDRPVVLTLRRKGGATFLMGEDFNFQFLAGESGKVKGYDFVQKHRIQDPAKPILNGETLFCDLQAKATFNTNNSAWTVEMKPGNSGGGIVASDKMLYEAPRDGYQPEYIIVTKDRKYPNEKYVYLKSRDPTVYTRVEIEHITANKEYLRLSGRAVTNPYGERNLEQATDLPYDIRKQLADDAKTAFRQNKRPAKPDLAKLLKEAKEKVGKNL